MQDARVSARAPAWARGIDRPIRIGVSSCLLGRRVRYDGGHKRDPFLTDLLGPFVEWVPVCPEVELGLGIPRPAVRLVRDARGAGVRLVEERSGADHTAAMRALAVRRARELGRHELSGYVWKKDSPSCGMERVRIWPASGEGPPSRDGRGLFADVLIEHMPTLPVEEEGRLHDARLRESFVERVFAYRRLRSLFAARFGIGDLVEFHTAHKLALLAHSQKAYAELGRLVAGAKGIPRADLRLRYETAFMAALATPATPKRHANVLLHALGHLRGRLDADSRAELASSIEGYRAGLVPLVVPITLLRHHVRALGIDYLAGQVYLDPHPRELMLRNHV
jgi:uncharacterized protein YbgA (DUF1722 family)/uncharacterized protein YbbK (DUF523 family)